MLPKGDMPNIKWTGVFNIMTLYFKVNKTE